MLKDYDNGCVASDSVKIKSNFHAHNYLCGHAVGTVSDYVKEAVDNGLEVIGISDHCSPPGGGFYTLPHNLQSDYLSQFDKARELYGDRIRILTAVEIEYFDDHDDFYEKLSRSLDYLVLGQHEFYLNGKRLSAFSDGTDEKVITTYFKSAERGVKSGFFALVAHPDLIFYQYPTITPKIVAAFDSLVKTACDCGVPLEFNANGIRNHGFRYPTDLLEELCKKYNAPVVVSSDCHAPKELCDKYMRELYAYAHARKLNVVDSLPLR